MEPAIYEKYGVDARFVGHPLADRFPLVSDRETARKELDLAQDAPVLAVLPGSRRSEIQRLGAIFLEAAAKVRAEIPNLQIVIPAANERCRGLLQELVKRSGRREQGAGESLSTQVPAPGSLPDAPLLLDGQSHPAMAAADVVLLASGTAALEAMLAKRPMVVAYRISPLTYRIVRGLKLLKTDLYSLPNALAAHRLVPELMQGECTAEKLAAEVLRLLREPGRRALMIGAFERMHLSLHQGGGAAAAAARAVSELLPPEHPQVST
jgi:lipid-A-disaccharide synthase